jgi:hypothetical protein
VKQDVHDLPSSGVETIHSPIHDIVIFIFESSPALAVRPPDVTVPILLGHGRGVLRTCRFARQGACQSQNYVLTGIQGIYLRVIV